MAKYFIFLDIDGVFATSRNHISNDINEIWSRFDEIAIRFMNVLDSKYPVEFVLMSTWKNGLELKNTTEFHWVNATFRNAGFRGRFAYPDWKTDFPEFPEGEGFKRHERAYEVKHYLEQHPCDDFLLFDDTSYRFNEVLGKKRHVRTSPEDGMLSKHMLHALSLTGSWEKKNK